MNITESQLERISKDLNNYASEAVKIELINDTVYAYGSELATLRILMKYRTVERARQGYSENLKTHYFSLDLVK